MGLFDKLLRKKSWDHVLEITDETFETQVIQRSFKQPLMVDFWATWCAPCRQLGPTLERIATEHDAPVHLAKVETSEAPEWSRRNGIQSIPHVKMFWNGKVVGDFRGVQAEANIRRWINEKMEQGAPMPKMKFPKDPEKRIAQAKGQLLEGKGFLAALNLRGMPDTEIAVQLLPVAEFLWDVHDGDMLTGDDKHDTPYIKAFSAMVDGDVAAAMAALSDCLLYTSPSPRDLSTSRMPSSA